MVSKKVFGNNLYEEHINFNCTLLFLMKIHTMKKTETSYLVRVISYKSHPIFLIVANIWIESASISNTAIFIIVPPTSSSKHSVKGFQIPFWINYENFGILSIPIPTP
jgi:hypothetical protein